MTRSFARMMGVVVVVVGLVTGASEASGLSLSGYLVLLLISWLPSSLPLAASTESRGTELVVCARARFAARKWERRGSRVDGFGVSVSVSVAVAVAAAVVVVVAGGWLCGGG